MDKKHVIGAGGLKFEVEYRHFGGDQGPAIYVFAAIKGEEVQLLRFDCFERDPHYHFDPDGENHVFHLKRDETPDPLAWSLEQIQERVVEMIRKAGYPEVADRVDGAAVAAAMPRIKAALQLAR